MSVQTKQRPASRQERGPRYSQETRLAIAESRWGDVIPTLGTKADIELVRKDMEVLEQKLASQTKDALQAATASMASEINQASIKAAQAIADNKETVHGLALEVADNKKALHSLTLEITVMKKDMEAQSNRLTIRIVSILAGALGSLQIAIALFQHFNR